MPNQGRLIVGLLVSKYLPMDGEDVLLVSMSKVQLVVSARTEVREEEESCLAWR
jgi:hypothetical protein